MSNNDDNNGSETRSSLSSLSRNALYAPLIAYGQQNVNPSAYMLTRKNVPSSIRESSLIEFLQAVGQQQLSLQNVEERIQQRALTLVGGGTTSKSSRKKQSKEENVIRNQQHLLSNRQRKKFLMIRQQQQQHGTKNNDKKKKEETFHLLLQLNARWNDYVRKLVNEGDLSNTIAMSRKLASHLELVGAFVRITKCSAHKQWVGREGMIVGMTVNTWRIAWIPRHVFAIKHNSNTPYCCMWKLLVVPKHGSQVAFSMPLHDKDENATTVTVVIHG